MGSPEAAPIPIQTDLPHRNAVFLGFGEAWEAPVGRCIPDKNAMLGQPLGPGWRNWQTRKVQVLVPVKGVEVRVLFRALDKFALVGRTW